MPSRQTIVSLPKDVLDELTIRLVDYSFSGYQELSDWLKSLGFEVSKSAIHRYGQKVSAGMDTDLRIKCVMAAASYSDSGSIIKNAKVVLAWVKSGR